MSSKLKPGSVAFEVARLTRELETIVTTEQVRWWRKKGYPLDDVPALQLRLANQERVSGRSKTKPASPPAPANDPDQAAPLSNAELDAKLGELQSKLLAAADYEDARKIRVQISGVRELFRTQVDRGFYIERAASEREGLEIGLLVRSLFLKIPAELPPMLVGLDYADAVAKCEDFAHQALVELQDLGQNQTVPCQFLDSNKSTRP